MRKDEPRIQRIERLLHAANRRRMELIKPPRDARKWTIRSQRCLQLEAALFGALGTGLGHYYFVVEINGRTYILDHIDHNIQGPYEVHRP